MSSSFRGKPDGYEVIPLRTNADHDWYIRKFPQFQQNELFSLSDAFRKLDVDDRGYVDEATAIKATQQSEHQPYDVVRAALKEVDLDSSRRVELEDYLRVSTLAGVLSVTIITNPGDVISS